MLNLIQDPYSEYSYPLKQKILHGYAKLENKMSDGDRWYSFFSDEDIKQMADDNDMSVEQLIEEENMEEANCYLQNNLG